MATARIYQRMKSSMQSGRSRVGHWMLEFEPGKARRADPLMGWVGGGDVSEQIRIGFSTLEAAKAYAEHYGIDYTVVPGHDRSLKLQAYADNFVIGPIVPAGADAG